MNNRRYEAINAKVMAYIVKGHEAGIQVLCFPEMALIGYDFKDMDQRLIEQAKLIEAIQTKALLYDMTILIGGIERDGSDYICQYVINKSIETYRKIHVGQKEGHYVAGGDQIKIFEAHGIKFGIMLCYDGHFPELATIMADQGAQLIFNPSASPNEPKKRLAMWLKYLVARAYDNRVWLLANNLRFHSKGGGMLAVDGDGNVAGSCTLNEDALLVIDYEPKAYSTRSMKNRDFKCDRKPDIYRKYING